jgi:hypothetical protein
LVSILPDRFPLPVIQTTQPRSPASTSDNGGWGFLGTLFTRRATSRFCFSGSLILKSLDRFLNRLLFIRRFNVPDELGRRSVKSSTDGAKQVSVD